MGEGVESCLGFLDSQIVGGCVRVLKGRWYTSDGFQPIERVQKIWLSPEGTMEANSENYEGFGSL